MMARACWILLPRFSTSRDTRFRKPCRDAHWSQAWRRNRPAEGQATAKARRPSTTDWRGWDTSESTWEVTSGQRASKKCVEGRLDPTTFWNFPSPVTLTLNGYSVALLKLK